MAAKEPRSDGQIEGIPYKGDPGIRESVATIMRRERNTPKEVFDPAKYFVEVKHEKYRPNKIQPKNALEDLKSEENFTDTTWLLPQIVGTSIAGPGRNADGIGSIPPDSVGDVGPTQVLMHANGRIKVYDKFTGAVGGLDVADTTFWNSVRNGQGVSDPRVEYDRLSGRWFLCMINVAATSNRILLAVSSGPTITNSASFTFYQITTPSNFLDYPTLGVDANALYIGGNIFTNSSGTFARTDGYVVNKANLIGGTLTATIFASLASGAGAGPLTPQGVSNDDPAATEGYFIGVDNVAFSLLQIRRVSDPGGTPTISANIPLATAATTYPLGGFTGVGVPFQGATSGRTLDDLDDRLFQAQITRDNITGVSRLWTSHNIEVTAAGTASTSGNRNGSRWYEITNLTGTPSINQFGTLFDSAATNPNSYWIPSVAVSGQGHMAIGASSAGAARFPSLYAAGRLRTDTANTIQAPTEIQTSTTAYNLEGAGAKQRWGDYSKTTVDPCDNQTFWHVGEYSDATNSWRMRAVQLRAAGPPVTVTPSPASVGTGFSSFNVTVTGLSVAGTEFYDNPAGFTCNASCSTTGTGNCRMQGSVTSSPFAPQAPLTINSVTFNSTTQVTLNISTVGATPGTHTIRITNPDGQFTSFNFLVAGPTAANASVSGRILTPNSAGLRSAVVSLTDSQGNVRTAISSSLGYYRFDDVEAGQTYTISVSSKRYQFTPRVVAVTDSISDFDFVATGPLGRK
ncbi:MAG: carboxypeptidase regulatory-like domain-containing protein [Blastocatellia bacterium]|nr:carboxypeptidase regulatory-like domain-containing protein [Blastocatellia bacterium]